MSQHSANVLDESRGEVDLANLDNWTTLTNLTEVNNLIEQSDWTKLGRYLNLDSIISTTSSFARQYQEAVTQPDLQHLISIGQGLQGIIFEQVGRPAAIKKELAGNEALRSNLKQEYHVHQQVIKAFSKYKAVTESKVFVPQLLSIAYTGDTEFWKNAPKFPEPHQAPSTVVEMDRILPLPKEIRKAFISQFHPGVESNAFHSEEAIDEVLHDTPNKHCLARTYLGRETGSFTKERFTLRNFPLYLQFMKDFGLEIHTLSSQMGIAFAIMHWGAGINGDDVEFVLGTSALDVPTSAGKDSSGFQYRAVKFYLLDFGQCDLVDMSEDKTNVYQSFKGAMVTGDNQLFIPNCLTTPELFSSFKNAYIHAGNHIIEDRGWKEKFDAEEFMTEYQEYAEDFL